MKLLDNEQIKYAKDTAEVAAQTFDTIGKNYEPYGMLIASASARAGVLFFNALGDELHGVEPALANLAYDAAVSLEQVVKDADDA